MTGKRDQKRPEGRFQQVCPRRLSNLPDAPCPLALERIQAIQNQKDKKTKEVDSLKGCAWYCTSADANYCFFSQIQADPGPYTDEDISAHLSLSTAQVTKTYESGMSKLRAVKDSESMQELKEMLQDASNRQSDNTVYLPDNFVTETTGLVPKVEDEEDEDLEIEETKKKPKRKTHLYGLYSQETLKRMKREGNAVGKPKKNDQED